MPRVKGNPECTRCGLHETADHVCLMGHGPVPSKLMIVGEAPGRREDDVGKPFQGRSGQLLDRVLEEVGLSREEIYITNSVHCRPPDNRTPSRGEIKACSPWLLKEIRLVEPEYILLLGATATKAVLGNSKIKDNRGKVIKKDGHKYICTYHPAAVLRTPSLASSFKSDLVRAKNAMEGNLTTDALNWVLVNDLDTLGHMMTDIENSPVLSYDLETDRLNMLAPGATVYCIGVATGKRQYVLPVDYPGSTWTGKGPQLVDMLSSRMNGKKLIGHNSKFDNKWLMALYGWDVPTTFDTMLASYILDENRRHGLKPLSKTFYQASDYEIPQPVDPKKVPLRKLAKYCAWDVYYTMRLYEDFKKELQKDKRLKTVFTQLIIPTSKMLEKVELHGVYIDPELHKEAIKVNSARRQEVLDELNGLAARQINWNSPQQVGELFFGTLSIPPVEFTKTGRPSTSESVLLRIKSKHPAVEKLLKYREYTKLGQFLESWKEHMDAENRMHPSFLIHGTVTGRLSCRDPNLQQVPRDTFLRSLIRAPEGKVFVEADYSQVELRVAALAAQEDTMKRAFQTGQDIHRITASSVMGIPEDQVSKVDRKKAKAVNFGFLYGMGAKKFKDYARDKYGVELSDQESRAFRDRFFSLYPGLPAWHDRQRRIAEKFGYVRTPMGRKRRLPDVYSPDRYIRGEAERQAINSPVQSFASDLTLLSMVLLSKEFSPEELQVVGLVHDAILFEVDEDRLLEILPEVKRVMEEEVVQTVQDVFEFPITVPLEVEIKYGPWGSGVEYGH